MVFLGAKFISDRSENISKDSLLSRKLWQNNAKSLTLLSALMRNEFLFVSRLPKKSVHFSVTIRSIESSQKDALILHETNSSGRRGKH